VVVVPVPQVATPGGKMATCPARADRRAPRRLRRAKEALHRGVIAPHGSPDQSNIDGSDSKLSVLPTQRTAHLPPKGETTDETGKDTLVLIKCGLPGRYLRPIPRRER